MARPRWTIRRLSIAILAAAGSCWFVRSASSSVLNATTVVIYLALVIAVFGAIVPMRSSFFLTAAISGWLILSILPAAGPPARSGVPTARRLFAVVRPTPTNWRDFPAFEGFVRASLALAVGLVAGLVADRCGRALSLGGPGLPPVKRADRLEPL